MSSTTDIDTTPVKCPNGCLIQSGVGKSTVAPRQFRWCDEADTEVGTRNYCGQCGTELVEADCSTIRTG